MDSRRAHVDLGEGGKEPDADKRRKPCEGRHDQRHQNRERVSACDDGTQHGAAAGKHGPVEAQFAGFFDARLVSDVDNACYDGYGDCPADDFPDR